VVFATALEGSRSPLRDVHAILEDNRLTLETADGFRLAAYELTLSKPVKQKTEMIIPAPTIKTLNALMSGQLELEVSCPSEIDIKSIISSERITINALSNTDDVLKKEESPLDSSIPVDVTVSPTGNQIQFKLAHFELTSPLIHGRFPDHEQFTPRTIVTKATLNVTEFLRATRTAGIFAHDGVGFIRLIVSPGGELAPGKITIYARSEGIGDNISEIDALVEGNESKIAFNAKYLTDVLNVLNERLITLETTDPSSPGVIKPVGNDNYVHMIMPMFVQW
jgi:DNA polymerase-3 subunit beta